MIPSTLPDILQIAARLTINSTDLFCMVLAFAGVYIVIALVNRLRRK